MTSKWSKIKEVFKNSDAVLAVGVIGIILLLIVPLPPFLLDLLLSLSIVFSVMALFLTVLIENPLEFSSFPSLLLFLTLYRLGLNIASTRMILTEGYAGDIIETFGHFVTKGSVLIGLVLFSLVTVINFIVVTKGAGRIAEVAARFTLEALPGKQLAIDSELNANLISLPQAKKERSKLNAQAEFYGAMDGASKFVRGDAIASVVITAVNIIGGLVLGLTVRHLSWGSCFSTFTKLTIGDGLLSAIPALLTSVSAGIMVTSGSGGSLGKTLPSQIIAYPKVLGFTAILIFLLGLLPGMPFLIMLLLAFALGSLALFRLKKEPAKQEQTAGSDEALERALVVHPIEVEVGVRLIDKTNKVKADIGRVRQEIAESLGVIIPSVFISCQTKLPSDGYLIKIKGGKMGGGRGGVSTIIAHFKEVVSYNADKLLNRQEVAHLIEGAKAVDSALIEELIPDKLKLGQLLKVLKSLLKEQIPIRDLLSILEILADKIPEGGGGDLTLLTEQVRRGLSSVISEHFFGEQRKIYAITLDPKVEKMLAASVSKRDPSLEGMLLPKTQDEILHTLESLLQSAHSKKIEPVVLTSAKARRHLRALIEKRIPTLPVLAYGEVSLELQTETVGVISQDVLIGK